MRRYGAVLLQSSRLRRLADFQAEREALVPGTYDPDGTTTGVFPTFDSVKTVATNAAIVGPTTQFSVGTTYSNIEFNYIPTPPNASGTVTFRNCKFRGPPVFSGGNVGLVKMYNTGHARVEFYDCTFEAQSPHPNLQGLTGWDYLLRRCDISRVQDHFEIFRELNSSGPSGVDIQQCYMHDLVFFTQAQSAALGVTVKADGTHCDVIQQQGGTGTILKYNTMNAITAPDFFNNYYDNSGNANGNITYQCNQGDSFNADIQFNWIIGGRAGINYTHSPNSTIPRFLGDVGTFKNNKFDRNQTVKSILRPTSNFTCDFGTGGTANVYTDNGQVVPQSNG